MIVSFKDWSAKGMVYPGGQATPEDRLYRRTGYIGRDCLGCKAHLHCGLVPNVPRR